MVSVFHTARVVGVTAWNVSIYKRLNEFEEKTCNISASLRLQHESTFHLVLKSPLQYVKSTFIQRAWEWCEFFGF